MQTRSRKRDYEGNTLPSASSINTRAAARPGTVFFPMFYAQLRHMWDFDNDCATKLGAPLRTCSAVENDNSGAVSETELQKLKEEVSLMWERAKPMFEIFFDQKSPQLGYRLRIKKSYPGTISFSVQDNLILGWCAVPPPSQPTSFGDPVSPCAHPYERSPVQDLASETRLFMGGPASYMNWMPSGTSKLATVEVDRPYNSTKRHPARLICRNLTAGEELTWNYGNDKFMPTPLIPWFQDECYKSIKTREKRHVQKSDLQQFIYLRKCVLCGEAFSVNNKEKGVERKRHFITSHADYLGSTWKGADMPYLQEEVDGLKVLTESDRLHQLISHLLKLNWRVIPACSLINSGELDAPACNKEELLQQLKDKCTFLRETGTLVLRGFDVIDREL